MPNKIAVLYSGGIDSTALAYYLADIFCLRQNPPTMELLLCDFGQASFNKCEKIGFLHSRRISDKFRIGCDLQTLECPLAFFDVNNPLSVHGFQPPDHNEAYDYTKQEGAYHYAHIEGRESRFLLNAISYCSRFEFPVLYGGHQYEEEEWKNLDSYLHRHQDSGPGHWDRWNLVAEQGFRNRVRLENPWITLRMTKLETCKMAIKHEVQIRETTHWCQFDPQCLERDDGNQCDNCICVRNALEALKI